MSCFSDCKTYSFAKSNIPVMTNDKTIILHTYNDLQEAIMIQDKLKENGIESYLEDENVMGLDPVGGVELRIFEKDIEAAEKIVAG
jgi:hypothetical protein